MTTATMQSINEAALFIKNRFLLAEKPQPKIAVVLGSGLSQFGDNLKNVSGTTAIAYGEIPHFQKSSVVGHRGELILSLAHNQYPIFALSGRLHAYEGHSAADVAFPLRVLSRLGIKTLIITNASGAIGDDFEPGELMVVRDHLNLTGLSPLVGPNHEELGGRFVDMTQAYDPQLIQFAQKAARTADIKMHEGIYAGLLGPCYETPAEIRMLKTLGADAVGMSTVFETIAARHLGLQVLAIASLTNKAAGLSSQKIAHEEVMDTNTKVAKKLEIVLLEVIKQIMQSR